MELGKAPWAEKDTNAKADVKALYEKHLASGLTPKDSAKLAQQETGHSAVTGQKIVKQVEFSATGKVGYSGQYPSRVTGARKHTKPAAWPR